MSHGRALPVARGVIAWAVVATIPDVPPRLWTSDGVPPTQPVDAEGLARALRDRARCGDEAALLIRARLRPVVLLQDRPRGVLRDVVALALVELEDLSESELRSVREQQQPSLFHLPLRPAKYGLNREMAVDLNALLRLGAGTLLARGVGRLDENEMRVIGERLVEHLDVDLEAVVARQVEERLTQMAGPAIL